jgi:hypothetical protein
MKNSENKNLYHRNNKQERIIFFCKHSLWSTSTVIIVHRLPFSFIPLCTRVITYRETRTYSEERTSHQHTLIPHLHSHPHAHAHPHPHPNTITQTLTSPRPSPSLSPSQQQQHRRGATIEELIIAHRKKDT